MSKADLAHESFLASVTETCYTVVNKESCEVQNPHSLNDTDLGQPSSSGTRVLPSPGGKVALASKTRPSFVKRQRERDQKQRRRLKDERRMERRALRAARAGAPGDDASEPLESAAEAEVAVAPAEHPAASA